jgi:hypothetical protein
MEGILFLENSKSGAEVEKKREDRSNLHRQKRARAREEEGRGDLISNVFEGKSGVFVMQFMMASTGTEHEVRSCIIMR